MFIHTTLELCQSSHANSRLDVTLPADIGHVMLGPVRPTIRWRCNIEPHCSIGPDDTTTRSCVRFRLPACVAVPCAHRLHTLHTRELMPLR